MVATARPLGRARASCSGGRCAARDAGFMSLFLVSIGLALVLRQVILLVCGAAAPRPTTSTRTRSTSSASVRLSRRAGRSRSSSRPSRFVRDRAVPARAPRLGRMMRALADDRALAEVSGIDVDRVIVVTWIISGVARRPRRACSPALVQSTLRPATSAFTLLLPDLRRRRPRRHRQRLRRARRRARARPRDGALDVGGLRRRRRPGLQAGRRVRRPDRRAAHPAAGPLREGARPYEHRSPSGEFWAFVGVVAGIYTIFALGLQLQFGFTGLLNFGQVAFMAIGAYTMAILVVKAGLEHVARRRLAVVAAMLAGVLSACRRCACGRTTSRSRRSPSARSSATSRPTRTGSPAARRARSTSRARARPRSTTAQWERLPGLGQALGSTSAPRTSSMLARRLDRRARSLRPAHRGGCADALGPGAARDPRGRGRGRVARARTSSPTSSRRSRSRRRSPALAGVLLRLAVLVLQPRRLRSR